MDKRRPFRKSKSPLRTPTTFKPRFARRYFNPRYKKEDRPFRRPGFSFRFQRYRPASAVRYHRSFPPKRAASPSPSSKSDSKKDSKCAAGTSKDHNAFQKSSKCKSREREVESIFSLKVTQENDALCYKEFPRPAVRAALRNRAIQRKRREIEEVYRQDCDTFGTVAKMLIAKDPSLEKPIQLSLQENLQDIGLRCAEALQRFIEEHDSKQSSSSSLSQP
ncbi:periphilin-1 isoform X2 [Amia ocellicauda]|uniref:periphilin-1 isoform X2 n=1 Tax=Amia ocellicauda TaxID=2972642 RepID=UPI003464D0DA